MEYSEKKLKKKFFANKYCNNCNISGHNYKDCTEPILSYGVICYRENKDTKKNEFLLIRRHLYICTFNAHDKN